MKRSSLPVIALLAFVLITGCSGDDDSGDNDRGDNGASSETTAETIVADTIVAKDFVYEPASVKAAAGSLTVKNEGSAAHTVTADDGHFDSGEIEGGGTGQIEVAPGEHRFHCEIHSGMKGTLVVE